MSPITAWRAVEHYGGRLLIHKGELHYTTSKSSIPDTVLEVLRGNKHLLKSLLDDGAKVVKESKALVRARHIWHEAEVVICR